MHLRAAGQSAASETLIRSVFEVANLDQILGDPRSYFAARPIV